MNKIRIHENLEFSRIVSGQWRLADWGLTKQELNKLINTYLDLGITTFDHADIYGNYSCEKLFGDALGVSSSLRKDIQIVTKCGIRLISENRPENKFHYYDTSKEHIIASVETSLKNFGTDHIELLLIHRPDPFMNPDEVAAAFSALRSQGKVLNFGVSNFLPRQFNMLSSALPFPLVTNQIEISPLCLDHFAAGTIDLCLERRIHPMAWSPLAGGRLFRSDDEQMNELHITLERIAEEIGSASISQLVFAWLLAHPAGIIPIAGSGNAARMSDAAKAVDIGLTRQQWFEILKSASGKELD